MPYVEFLIYRLSSTDGLMMNQPVNVEERNEHGLENVGGGRLRRTGFHF